MHLTAAHGATRQINSTSRSVGHAPRVLPKQIIMIDMIRRATEAHIMLGVGLTVRLSSQETGRKFIAISVRPGATQHSPAGTTKKADLSGHNMVRNIGPT